MSKFFISTAVALSPKEAAAARCDVVASGFPVLYREDGTVEHEATLFLASRCLGGGSVLHLRVDKSTAATVAYRLRDFLEFMVARNIKTEQLSIDALYAYAATMANVVSPHTGEIYSQHTIARRISIALQFAGWLADRGAIPRIEAEGIRSAQCARRPFSWGSGSTRHFRRSVRATLLPTPQIDHEPRILSEAEAKSLLSALAAVPDEISSKAAAIRRRNVLMAKLSLCAGLRRSEVCGLDLATIMAVVPKSDDRALCAITLTRTKNSVRRKVLISTALVKELLEFVRTDRQVLHPQGNKLNLQDPIFPSARSRKHCVRLTPKAFASVISDAAMRAGIVTMTTKASPNGMTKTIKRAGMSTHDLRHTYAVWSYLLLRAQGDTNPWLFVQAQLGHRSAETTLNIYLRAVRIFETQVSDAIANYVHELESLLTGATDEQV